MLKIIGKKRALQKVYLLSMLTLCLMLLLSYYAQIILS